MIKQNYNPQKTLLEQYRAATVVGLGATGYSVVRYLHARGVKVKVVDTRQSPALAVKLKENYPDVEYHFGGLDHAYISQASLLVVSPGIAIAQPELRDAKKRGACLIGDISLFVEENKQKILAITGSNGKSTVTSLVGHMCDVGCLNPLVAGNIGLPVLDALTDGVEYDIAVLELSSFQLETTKQLNAHAAVILNVTIDHMDRYDAFGDYLLAKLRVTRGAQRIILPRHDEQLKQFTLREMPLLTFDLDKPANDSEFGMDRVSNHRWLVKGTERLIKVSDIPLNGTHNISNVLAAYALVDSLGLDKKILVSAVKSFIGLKHRMQTINESDHITWINDSKATNVDAAATALQGSEKDLIWIAGGQSKGADFTELKEAVKTNHKAVIIFGEDADMIESALKGKIEIHRVETMAQAVDLADNLVCKFNLSDAIVLLSPACASFDMYTSFQQRGDDFASCVANLLANKEVLMEAACE